MKWMSCSRRCRGATLVEVVAGLALLGLLLSAIVTGRSRYVRQWAEAGARIEAATAADALLSEWWTEPHRLPEQTRGVIGTGSMWWRLEPVVSEPAEALGLEVLRLSILSAASQAQEQREHVLVAVEFVRPAPQASVADETQEAGDER